MMQAPSLQAQSPAIKKIDWAIAAQLPPARANEKALGQAGVFAGLSEDVLLVAGGSYFPDKKPWEGGQKTYVANIFALEKDNTGHFSWIGKKWSLKHNKAYGASATTAYGVVCAGGENQTANCSREAFLLRWNKQNRTVICQDLPDLPIPLTNACMTAIGSNVYLVGGETGGKPSARVFTLDLAAKVQHWESLPDMPMAMSHSVAVAQSNGRHTCVYVIGGRSSSASGISTLHNNGFCYDPQTKSWHTIAPIGNGAQPTNLSASAGVAIGKDAILMIGGDRGDIFHQIEVYNQKLLHTSDSAAKQQLQTQKLNLITNHPGFSRTLLVYHIHANTWEKAGELPFAAHVTTTAVLWDNRIFIPGGEIKPGTRTPDILQGNISGHVK